MRLSPRFADRFERFRQAVMSSPGDTSSALRAAAFARSTELAGVTGGDSAPVPDELDGFLDKIAHLPYSVSDADVDELRRRGYSEDAIFELIHVAVVGAGWARLNIALQAMGWEPLNETPSAK